MDFSGHFLWAATGHSSASVLSSAGGNTVVDGYGKAQNSPELAVEEYALMSIDTIINGKVGPAACPTGCARGWSTNDVSCFS